MNLSSRKHKMRYLRICISRRLSFQRFVFVKRENIGSLTSQERKCKSEFKKNSVPTCNKIEESITYIINTLHTYLHKELCNHF